MESRNVLKDINQKTEENPMSTKAPVLGRTRSRTQAVKREAPADEASPVKRQKTKAEPAETPPEKQDPDAVFINNIIQVLGKHYFDVVDRLSLDAVPDCVTNMVKCTENHSTTGSNNEYINEFDEFLMREVGAFVNDGKIEIFYDQLSNIVMKGEFPGEHLLQLMLETMLAVNERPKESNVENLLEISETIFMQTIHKFPPCWTKVRDHYLKIMTEPLQLENFQKKKEYESQQGLFNLLIALLEHNVRTKDENLNSSSKNRHNLCDSMDMNFAVWEEYTKQTYDFNKNTRDEKLERIFRVLGLFVQLMEHDLSIWMLRNPRNIHKSFIKSEKKPLIASLLWPNQECSLNFAVKRIMKIFIECVHLNYPSGDLQVLSRLMNLIATCINVSEIRTIKEKSLAVNYPSINNNSELFAKELKRLIDDFPHFSISLYVNVLKNLRTPCIKAVLARQILTRINPSKDVLKPGRDTPLHYLMQSLNNRDWRNTSPRPSVSHEDNNEKYPIMPTKASTRKKALDVYQEDLIFIQLTELQSYMAIYRVTDVYNSLRTTTNVTAEMNNNKAPPEATSFSQFDTKMLKDLSKHVVKHEFPSLALPKNDPVKFVFKSINIEQNLIMNYREQIKLCYYLQSFFDKAVAKYPELGGFKAYFDKSLDK